MSIILFWCPGNMNIMAGSTTITYNMIEVLLQTSIMIHFLTPVDIIKSKIKNKNLRIFGPSKFKKDIIKEDINLINIINNLDKKFKYKRIFIRSIKIWMDNKLCDKLLNKNKIDIFIQNGCFTRFNKLFFKKLYDNYGYLICSTNLCKTKLRNLIGDKNNKMITFMPVINKIYKVNNNVKKSIYKILYTGSLKKHYMIKEIIESIIEINKLIDYKIELHIFGEGFTHYTNDEIIYINNLINMNKDIIFLNKLIPHTLLMSKIKEYDIGISLRNNELYEAVDISSKILEYSGNSLPVLLNKHIVNVDAYGKDYPCYVENKEDIKKIILELLNDIEKITESKEMGYKAAEKYSYQNNLLNIKKIYKNIIPKILIFQPTLTIKVYKYANILSKYYNVELGYTTCNFDKNYILDKNFTELKISNLENIINNYKLVIFKDINPILMNIYDKYREKIIILISDIYFCRSNNRKYAEQEKKFIKNIDPNNVIFSGYFIKKYIVDYLDKKFMNSVIIPNVPMIENIPQNIEKLSEKDNKIHLVYCGTLQKGNNHRNYQNIILNIIKYDNIMFHIIPTKHDSFLEYIDKNYKNIKIHKTQNHTCLHKYLTQFDIGFAYYSVEHSDKDYINISEGNKFYDYLFAGLPIIANNSESYNFLINKYKCGRCVNNLDNLDEIVKEVIMIKIDFNCIENSLDNYIDKNKKIFKINF